MNNESKMRVGYIDSIKGLAIFLVVMGHAIAWQFEDFYGVFGSGEKLPLFWWFFIYSFHMPLFMFVSGYLFPHQFKGWKDISSYLIRKIYTLAIPFTVCTIFITNLLGGGNYWFLKTLFIIIFINTIGEIISQRFKQSFVVDVIFYIMIFVMLRILVKVLPGNIIQAVDFEHLNSFNYLAFCFGTLCRKYNFANQILENKKSFTVSIIIFFILFFCNIKGYNNKLFWLIPWGGLPLSGIICCWQLFRFHFTDGKIVKTFQYLGKHSLEIYILHFYFACNIPIIGTCVIELTKTGNAYNITTACNIQLIMSLLISCIICVLCIATFKVIRFSNVLSLLIFGRKNK